MKLSLLIALVLAAVGVCLLLVLESNRSTTTSAIWRSSNESSSRSSNGGSPLGNLTADSDQPMTESPTGMTEESQPPLDMHAGSGDQRPFDLAVAIREWQEAFVTYEMKLEDLDPQLQDKYTDQDLLIGFADRNGNTGFAYAKDFENMANVEKRNEVLDLLNMSIQDHLVIQNYRQHQIDSGEALEFADVAELRAEKKQLSGSWDTARADSLWYLVDMKELLTSQDWKNRREEFVERIAKSGRAKIGVLSTLER